MKYLEMVIDANSAGAEVLGAVLGEIGIDNIVIDDPVIDMEMAENLGPSEYLDPEETKERLARKPTVTAYFEYTKEGESLAQSAADAVKKLRDSVIRGDFGEDFEPGTLELETRIRDDEEWKDVWKAFFKPQRIGERISVKPSWEEYSASEGELVIEMDPGMAFGTGTHETTSMCIQMLEKYVRPDSSVMDVGSGSGILSIAAALLGAKSVLGIDIDPDAVRVMRENVERNGLSDRIVSAEGDLTNGVDFSADVVVGNLLAPIVLLLAKDVSRHLKPGGVFISSGILLEQEEMVVSGLREQGFSIPEIRRDGNWCCIVANTQA